MISPTVHRSVLSTLVMLAALGVAVPLLFLILWLDQGKPVRS